MLFCFLKWKEKEAFLEADTILLRIVDGNSDIELSDEEDQDAVFEAEAEEDYSESNEDEIQAGQADAEESDQAEQSTSQSSRRPLWSKNTKYTLSLYSKKTQPIFSNNWLILIVFFSLYCFS